MINSGYLEPITRDMIEELEAGEWIWDDKLVVKREHRQCLRPEDIEEPYGFRQIHIIDIPNDKFWYYCPKLMLSDRRGGYEWEYFEAGRYFRFKKEKEKNNDRNSTITCR